MTIQNSGTSNIHCNYYQQDEQNSEAFLASFLEQLTQGLSSLPNIKEILGALNTVTTLYSTIFIVINALDECQVSGGCRAGFLKAVFSLQAKRQALHLSATIMLNRIFEPNVRTDSESQDAARELMRISRRLQQAKYLQTLRSLILPLLIFIAAIEIMDVFYQDWALSYLAELGHWGANN